MCAQCDEWVAKRADPKWKPPPLRFVRMRIKYRPKLRGGRY